MRSLERASRRGATRTFVWPDMTHEFHGHGPTLPQARQALEALRSAVVWATTEGGPPWPALPQTELDSLDRHPVTVAAEHEHRPMSTHA